MAYTTINKSSLHFNTVTYTGNGSTQNITGVGFQPDLVWAKRRSADGWHFWTDAVRGAGKVVYSNRTDAEFTDTDSSDINSFLSDGFSVGSNADINGNGQTHVGWNWKANGAGSANTDGSTNSTVSVNTTAGFSIVKYTGTSSNATVGHGLGAVPKFIAAKRLTDAESWGTYHVSNGAGKYMKLENTEAVQTASSVWNNTTPTSSVFSLGTSGLCNGSAKDMIAYCFAEKTGYSKFGSYKGNGDADGTFVYTGFKPALIIIKSIGYAENWFIFDNKRPGYNFNANLLNPNSDTSETTSGANGIDIISNGFKTRATNNGVNRSGDTFIYMAFGQSLVGSNNVPCTAR